MKGPAAFAVGPPHDPDRYVLGEARGVGGESIVYRAHRGDREVAVKILREDHRWGLDQLAGQWMSQVELLRTLRHPAVVRPIEAFIGTSLHRRGREPVGRSLCLVMEWIEGRELDSVIQALQGGHGARGVCAAPSMLEALRPVADALDLMHTGERTDGEPVVHGDIKPSNVLLRPSGEAVLVDFGLASAMARRPTGGTPSYRAPESYRSGNSPATDVFSFAAVIAVILTADSVSIGECDVALPKAVRSGLSSKPAERPERLVPWLDAVIAGRAAEPAPSTADSWRVSFGRRRAMLSAAAAVSLVVMMATIRSLWGTPSDLGVSEAELAAAPVPPGMVVRRGRVAQCGGTDIPDPLGRPRWRL